MTATSASPSDPIRVIDAGLSLRSQLSLVQCLFLHPDLLAIDSDSSITLSWLSPTIICPSTLTYVSIAAPRLPRAVWSSHLETSTILQSFLALLFAADAAAAAAAAMLGKESDAGVCASVCASV